MMRRGLARFWNSLSVAGLLLGTLFFVGSLTPSLVPRTYVMQGALAGICFAAGYGIGVGWRWLWFYMELPGIPDRSLRVFRMVATVVCAVGMSVALWQAAEWQNSIRVLMKMEPLSTGHPFEVWAIAAATFVLLIAVARLFVLVFRLISGSAGRVVPPRISKVLGFSVAVVLFWGIANGVLFRFAFHVLDSSFRELDALIEPQFAQPDDPLKTGSAASLVKWTEVGRAGREFVTSGPTSAEIGAFTGRNALEPLRVYVGLRAAETVEERASLALEELKRVGGFDRSVLVVITPTGTGWVDPAAMDSIEYLEDGDIASVALQYSYLSSPLSLMVQPEYGEDAARALFDAVYSYWTTLPRDQRPRLFLHGLSLGSMNSEKSVQFLRMLGDPINGALWSGPPFESTLWRSIVDDRNSGSPAWLPQFGDGSHVRFMNQDGATVPADTPWGAMRIVYLQYASDAVTFFDIRDVYREPAWMTMPRGPDVSSQLRWYPVVSMLQLAFDMAVSTSTPIGYGHVYASEHYIEAWVAVADVRGWSAEQVARLKQSLADQQRAAAGSAVEAYENRGG
ncbi:alpha/beta-hydrolase family protein [Mesorhizobium sp. YM1C-6-2]|uniref:alpha/beta hydrolase n=1 Tax=Mesorhizobium sp. YM1C-6-2 TaxID=1827501 RepID=UPI000EF17FB2|nr:alpha/beta-hydrolase family protein [Mesorhizobium sp. YM1C-6-2]RLP27051.1 hypothetical protein D8676_07600 [Mesorhizobium sp. YM1C-6-2]